MSGRSKDHRTRVAQQRRDRMRERLLDAVMRVYAQRGQHATPVIDDVIREAKVARGTFYKYFLSIEDAANALGRELSEQMTGGLDVLYGSVKDPLLRMGTGSQLFLLRAVIDPVWGAFVSRTDYLTQDTQLLRMVTADVEAAQTSGVIPMSDIDAAVDLLLGSIMMSIRRLSGTKEARRSYVENMAVMLLCGVGVEMARATDVVRDRAIYIRGLAPDHLSWWRDPWLPS